MAKQDKARDYREIVSFSQKFIGRKAVECIEAYAAKRKMAEHRAGKAFWDKVDEGLIKTVVDAEGYDVITETADQGAS
jgi:hypothetical protein